MANLLQGIGEAKPVSDFLNMALKYKDSTTQNALREQHANLLKMQTDKLAEEEAYRKQPYNMNLDPLLSAYEQGTPEHSDFKKKYFNLAQADQYGNTTMGNRDRAVGELAKDHVALKDLYDRKSQLMLDQYNKIQDDLSNANLTGDTAKVNKLTIMSDALKTKLIAASGHLATWDAANEKTKAAGAAVSKILVEPDTGERYTQLKSGAILDGQGNDVSSEIDTTNLIVEGSDKLPKDTVPSAIKEFESVYPGMAGKAGTPEYTKGYEKFLELKGNRINAVTYLGQNEQGDFIVGKTRGVGAGAPPQVVPNPAGGQLKPNVVRPLGSQEQEKFVGASNIAHVLPDMIPFRDLVRAKGGPIIDQVRGKAAEKMIDAGLGSQTGLPPEAIKAHVAVTHLKTWATGMLKGAGSDVQRAQLIATLPTLYDSADVIDQKMRKTINIVRRIATNTIQSAAAGGKAVPPDMYRQLADMEDFANQLGSGEIPTDLPKGTVDLGNGMYKLPNGKTVRKQ